MRNIAKETFFESFFFPPLNAGNFLKEDYPCKSSLNLCTSPENHGMSVAQRVRFAVLPQGYPPTGFHSAFSRFGFKHPSPCPPLLFNVEMTESFLSPLE